MKGFGIEHQVERKTKILKEPLKLKRIQNAFWYQRKSKAVFLKLKSVRTTFFRTNLIPKISKPPKIRNASLALWRLYDDERSIAPEAFSHNFMSNRTWTLNPRPKNFNIKNLSKKTFENLHCLEQKTAVQQWDISMSHLESEPSWAQHLAVHRNTSKPPGFILSHRKIAKIKQNWSFSHHSLHISLQNLKPEMIEMLSACPQWSHRGSWAPVISVLSTSWNIFVVQVDWKQNKTRTTVTPPMRQHTHFPVHVQRNVYTQTIALVQHMLRSLGLIMDQILQRLSSIHLESYQRGHSHCPSVPWTRSANL